MSNEIKDFEIIAYMTRICLIKKNISIKHTTKDSKKCELLDCKCLGLRPSFMMIDDDIQSNKDLN